MTMTRTPESLRIKEPELLFLSAIAALATFILSDTLEDTLMDGRAFNFAFAVVGVLLLVAAIGIYKFESAYNELYRPL